MSNLYKLASNGVVIVVVSFRYFHAEDQDHSFFSRLQTLIPWELSRISSNLGLEWIKEPWKREHGRIRVIFNGGVKTFVHCWNLVFHSQS